MRIPFQYGTEGFQRGSKNAETRQSLGTADVRFFPITVQPKKKILASFGIIQIERI